MSRKNDLQKECLDLVEVLSDEAVEDVLIFAKLKIAMQEDKDIFISASDWDKTPDSIKQAISKIINSVFTE